MTLGDAIVSGVRRYLDFQGRSSRSEFWYWMLFTALVQFCLSLMSEAVLVVFVLAALLPSVAVGVRRLHDTGRSGWWFLLWLVPLVGTIVLIVQATAKGTSGANQFGADPLALAAPAAAPG